MFRIQSKLFFRSPLRVLLVLALFGGSLYYYGPAILYFIKGEIYYAGLGMLQNQMRDFVYVFLVVLFLAFDYFREVPDAAIQEPLRAGRKYQRQDLVQAAILMLVVCAYALCFFLMHIACHIQEGSCTWQLVFYYLRLTGCYYILNGLVAVLAGWLSARIGGKIVGYICMICFAVLVSPLMTSMLESYSYFGKWVSSVSKVFLIMPQGTHSLSMYCLFPANWSIAARGLFWVGLFSGLLALWNLRGAKQGRRRGGFLTIVVSGLCAGWALLYSGLPASYYCVDYFISCENDQWRYVQEQIEQQEQAADFQILSYDMDLKLGRQMRAKVTCVPSDQNLETYALTLYRLYQIDRITDENGEELKYQREENTLLIYGQADGIQSFTLEYHGGPTGESALYNNRYALHLPGWFAYYPIPGYQAIYALNEDEEWKYVDNRLETEAEFQIRIQTAGTVYSDLERVAGNTFQGSSRGPSLLSGFVREMYLENGTKVIYPYSASIDIVGTKEEQEYVATVISLQGDKLKLIMATPLIAVGAPGIYEEDHIIAGLSFVSLSTIAKRSGQFDPSKAPKTLTEEDRISTFCLLYRDLKEMQSKETIYETVLEMYLSQMEEFGYTEADFEDFIIDNLGQEEWDYLKECQEQNED